MAKGIYGDYELELTVNDFDLEVPPDQFTLSLTDSIHKVFSTAEITVHDYTAFYQEFLGVEEGNIANITFKKVSNEDTGDNKNNEGKYVITSNKLPEVTQNNNLGGYVEIDLKHEWYNKQTKQSRSFDDRISGVVNKLAGRYDFNSLDIHDTENRDYYYQAMKTEAELIKNVFLRKAYSTNANGTPFYAYITTDNVFHFKTLQHMWDSGSKRTIEAINTQSTYHSDKFNPEKGTIHISRWNEGSSLHKKDRRKEFYYFDRETGEMTTETDTLDQHPKAPTKGKVPVTNDSGETTGYRAMNMYSSDSTLKGKRNNAFRDSVLMDRFYMVIPFDPKLHAGDKITVNIYYEDIEAGQLTLSPHFSGDYIIEMAEHTWSGFDKKASTKLVIGRQKVKVPQNYKFRGLLL